ncbi:heme-binding protein [Kutzneria sp. NPDC052558]|uniref:heme-binding protein n=1 Tax=Kutzneria sp. NPDC052558 TaxID=3364121 RepID=UPI0037CB2355
MATATSLTLRLATAIADTALAHARELGCAPLTVAVLDPGGHLQVLKREDTSGILRPDIAFAKAWGCLGMGLGGRALAERCAVNPAIYGVFSTISGGRLMPAAGGVLVRDGSGALLGAVGVSGDRPERDEECAVAGVTAVHLVADVGV